ncbi:MaoC/PaaZ C-terminal domain-containing protein [Mycobacterium sherrisii]|uniref:MaoC/PaaZ C-terminal domain-containing protein n=1 Tax=Mycobacterium sherrisii TaxID=243061 RepID=UPI0039756E8A
MSLPDHQKGTQLPTLEIPVDRTTIVAAAIASQDFEDVHHDPGKAQERGTPDIFMSINSTNGFVDRYITDWAGPGSRITRVALRLGVPMFAGDTLTMAGEVVDDTDGATIKITGSNSRGVHVSGQVQVVEYNGGPV